MKPEIKQRIEQLNNGEIPKGYKKTDFGVFPNDWVTDNTLGDLFDFYGGLSKSRDELGEEGYAYLHYGDLHRGTFNTVSIKHYEQLPKCDILLTGKEKCLMKDGDVAFLDASEDLEGTSRAVLIDNPENKPFIAGLHIIYGKAKNNSLDKWFKQYITSSESVKKQFQRLAVGFKVYGVNRDTIPRIKVAFPSSKKEQSQIAKILMKWDEAIELYDKQIDALNRYKAVCLRKMFPAKGQNAPEWRFQGFTDAWEQRKVGEITSVLSASRVHKDEWETEGVPFYRSSDVVSAFKGNDNEKVFISAELYEELIKSSGRLEQGDILITGGGSIGIPYIVPNNAPLYSKDADLIWIKKSALHDSHYLYTYFTSQGFRDYIRSISHIGTIAHYTIEQVKDTPVLLPEMAEQMVLGNFFGRIDNLITLHQRKKEAIINQRKTLQQYLLNGIIRV